jgi:hypothetical protein
VLLTNGRSRSSERLDGLNGRDTLAEPKPRSRKRTYAYLFRSMRTLRFLLIARAGRLSRLDGRNVLRLTKNPATETLYGQIAHRLAA